MATILGHIRLRVARRLYEVALSQSEGHHTQPTMSINPSSPSLDQSARFYPLSELSDRYLKRFQRYKFKRLGQLSRLRAQIEMLYRDLGKKFFWFPLEYRKATMGDTNIAVVFIGTVRNPEPDIVGQLEEFRDLFDEFKHHVLVLHDMRKAKKMFRLADELLYDMKDTVLLVRDELKSRKTRYREFYFRNEFPDKGLPVLPADENITTAYEEKLAEICAWLSGLPEVKKAVEDGFTTVDQELEDFLSVDRCEEQCVDDDDLEFSDMESCSDYDDSDDEEDDDEEGGVDLRDSYGPLVPPSWTHKDE